MSERAPQLLTPERPLRVLVFPGGTEVGLEVAAALRYCKEVVLFSAGLDVPNHAPFVFARHFVVPSVHKPGWLDALNSLVREHRIDCVFPAYDDVSLALADNEGRLACPVVGPPPPACRVARFKSLTYDALADAIAVPERYTDPRDVPEYPVFVKPDRGQGSEGARLVRTAAELETELARDPSLLVLEHLPGREFTVDCLSDRDRGLLFCGGRERLRTKSGIVMTTRAADRPEFRPWAEFIHGRLGMRGAWFFQAKEARDGRLKLLEVGPRVAGGMGFHRALGVNFPLLALYEHVRRPVAVRPLAAAARMDRALVSRFETDLTYDAVYVDLDDTLVFRGAVNTALVGFLYQCVNAGKWLALLTRSRERPQDVLARHRLAGLFDEVIWIDREARKSDHITRRPAVLIDDSFRERAEVTAALGVPALDCGMLDLLLDSRA